MTLKEYPKDVGLKDGSAVTLRPIDRRDEKPLLDFFMNLPEEDRLYLRHDVSNPEVVRSWMDNLDYDRFLPIIALSGDRIVGNATLYQNPFSWMRHVGSIRIVIAPDFRGKGMARVLAAEIVHNALARDLEKLVAEMATDQHDARKVFSKIGFREEAVLKDHITDARGTKHDLLIMTNDVNALWRKWMEFVESVSGPGLMEH